jgi:hypothetical protein
MLGSVMTHSKEIPLSGERQLCETREGKMEREILIKILELVNKGHKVAFEEDWGGNSITVFIDDSHTHCGIPEGSFDSLVKSLHETLVRGGGLAFW